MIDKDKFLNGLKKIIVDQASDEVKIVILDVEYIIYGIKKHEENENLIIVFLYYIETDDTASEYEIIIPYGKLLELLNGFFDFTLTGE